VNLTEVLDRVDGDFERIVDWTNILSLGEQQRVSFARIFLRKPVLAFLDEATSSLDARSERLVQEAIEGLLAGRTTFVIAHRLSTVRHADKIVVLEHGALVELGTHEELLAKRGRYAELMSHQSDGVS